jgi:hypothetical protein
MKFTICNKQNAVSIDEDFWKRAFNYAATELGIEHHRAEVACFFIPMEAERGIKFKMFSLGATGLTYEGAMFYVVSTTPPTAADFLFEHQESNNGRMVKTFFHEMTHVKQLLMGELIPKQRRRYLIWKGEKWDNREYSYAPWEVEAAAFSEKAYQQFMQREVNRVMQDENVHAYHPSVRQLCLMFSEDEVFHLTQGVYKERER